MDRTETDFHTIIEQFAGAIDEAHTFSIRAGKHQPVMFLLDLRDKNARALADAYGRFPKGTAEQAGDALAENGTIPVIFIPLSLEGTRSLLKLRNASCLERKFDNYTLDRIFFVAFRGDRVFAGSFQKPRPEHEKN